MPYVFSLSLLSRRWCPSLWVDENHQQETCICIFHFHEFSIFSKLYWQILQLNPWTRQAARRRYEELHKALPSMTFCLNAGIGSKQRTNPSRVSKSLRLERRQRHKLTWSDWKRPKLCLKWMESNFWMCLSWFRSTLNFLTFAWSLIYAWANIWFRQRWRSGGRMLQRRGPRKLRTEIWCLPWASCQMWAKWGCEAGTRGGCKSSRKSCLESFLQVLWPLILCNPQMQSAVFFSLAFICFYDCIIGNCYPFAFEVSTSQDEEPQGGDGKGGWWQGFQGCQGEQRGTRAAVMAVIVPSLPGKGADVGCLKKLKKFFKTSVMTGCTSCQGWLW